MFFKGIAERLSICILPFVMYNVIYNINNYNNIDKLWNNDNLQIVHPRIELLKKSPLHSWAHLWNSVGDIEHQHCRETFKNAVIENQIEI